MLTLEQIANDLFNDIEPVNEEEVSLEEDGDDSYEEVEVEVSHDINIDDLLNHDIASNLVVG